MDGMMKMTGTELDEYIRETEEKRQEILSKAMLKNYYELVGDSVKGILELLKRFRDE